MGTRIPVPTPMTYWQDTDFGLGLESLPDPDLTAISKLGFDVMPFGFVIFDSLTLLGGFLPAQATAYGKYSTPEECWVVQLVASSAQAAGFSAQIYDTDREELWNAQPIVFSDGFGSAQKPFTLRRPYAMPVNAQLQVKVTNLAVVGNTVQLVCWGVRK